MTTIHRRPQARQDLIDIASYLGMSDPSLGDAFLEAAEDTFILLADMPGIGPRSCFTTREDAAVHYHPIRRFPNHLIFFLPTESGIEVVRVLHGARNLAAFFRA